MLVKITVKSTKPDTELKLLRFVIAGVMLCLTLRMIVELPGNMEATR